MRNKKDWIVAGLTLAVAMFGLTGCETAPKDERSSGLALDDKHITEKIKKSLDSEPTYKFTGVEVSTFAGIVQLSGFVNSNAQKNRAQQIAQHTEGAREVVNGITLKPVMPTATSWTTNSESRIYTTVPEQTSQPNQTTEPNKQQPK